MTQIRLFVCLSVLVAAASFSQAYAQNFSLTTNFTGNVTGGNGGNVFDVIVGANGISITRFDVNMGVTTAQTVDVYFKVGTYVGSQTTAANWTLHDTVTTTGAGAGNPTPVNLNTPLFLNPGTLYGIAVVAQTTALRYTSNTATVQYSDANITVELGRHVTVGFGASNANREWNGTIHYTLATADHTLLTSTTSNGTLSQGATNTVVMRMTANTYGNNHNLNDVTFTQIGTMPDGDITAVTLYRDDGTVSGDWDASDTQLGTGTLTGGAITFTGTPLQGLTAGSPVPLLLTVNTAATLTPTDTIQFQIGSSSHLTWSGGTDLTTFPVTGGTHTYVIPSTVPEVLYFKFDEGSGTTTANDASPGQGNNPATLPTGASWSTPGQVGAAALNVSTSNALDTGWSAALGATDSFTLETWIYSDATSFGYLFYFQGSPNFRIFQNSNGSLSIASTGGTPSTNITTSAIAANTWTHLALVYDHIAGTFTVYFDGNIDSTNTRTCVVSGNLIVGSNSLTSSASAWPGRVDEFRLWSTARSQAEIQANMNQQLPAIDSTSLSVRPTSNTISPPISDLVVLDINASTFINANDLDSLTVSRTGSMNDGDFSNITLYLDVNDDGIVDGGDQVLDTGTLTSGVVTFSGAPDLVQLSTAASSRLLLSVDIAGTFAPGTNFQFSITGATFSGGTDLTTYPQTGTLVVVSGPASTFPYELGFETPAPYYNAQFTNTPGGYPAVVTIGGTPGSGGAAGTGNYAVTSGPIGTVNGGTTPNSGNGMLDMFGATNIGATAMDLAFDMTGVSVTDYVELEFSWADQGMDVVTATDPMIGVFLSTDGGTTWELAVFQIPTNAPEGVWYREHINLSDLMAAASLSYTGQMVIRFQMAENLTSDHLLLDDIRVDVPDPQLRVLEVAESPTVVWRNYADRVLGTFDLFSVNSTQAVDSITFEQSGTVLNSDLADLKLWVDANGDGVFNAGDTQVGSTVAVMSGSTVTITSGSPFYTFTRNEQTRFFLTGLVSAAATLGDDVQFSITAAGDVSSTPGFVAGTFPVDSAPVLIKAPASSFPFLEDFESQPDYPHAVIRTGAQTVPTVVTVGGVPGTGNVTGASGFAVTGGPIGTAQGGQTPQAGAGMLDFFGGTSTGSSSIDLLLDMSSFSLTDYVELGFYWADQGMDSLTLTNPMQGVFISTNGGTTWELTVFQFPVLDPEGFWYRERINLSAMLSAASLDYTSNMIIRFQMAENGAADHLLLDEISVLEITPSLAVQTNTAAPANVTRSVSGDQWVASFDALSAASAQTPTSVTFTQVGTFPSSSLTNLKLWLDSDASGTFTGTDTQLGSTVAAMTGNSVTFSGTLGSFNINDLATFFITAEVGTGGGGSFIRFEVTAAGDISTTPGPVSGNFPVQGAQVTTVAPPLSGTVTVANGNPGGAFDYGDLGDVFVDLETSGLAGPLVIEMYDTGGAFTSSPTYRLGGSGTATTVVPIGLSTTNTLTIRAAAGHSPVIQGSGVVNPYSGTAHGTMAFRNAGNVTVEGLTITGGNDFGLMFYASASGSADNIVVRGCRIHGITAGAAIFTYASLTGGVGPHNVLIENNMIWNVAGDTTWQGGDRLGVLGSRRPGNNFVVRHNSIHLDSTSSTAAVFFTSTSTAGDSFADLSYNAVHVSGSATAFRIITGDAPTVADRNVFFLDGSATMSNSTSYATWALWQASGRDTNGLNADPLFVSTTPGSEDLDLTGFSPAIDLAVGSPVTVDIYGTTRPIDVHPDAGAHERASAPRPEMEVSRTAFIASGGTDALGDVSVFGQSVTWTIDNIGPGDLTITTPISFTQGTGNPGLTVSAQPSNTVQATTGTTTFTFDITPAVGPFAFQIEIFNNDINNNPYVINVTGNGFFPNDAAEANPATGSIFSGAVNGPFTTAIVPGGTLNNASIELTDNEADDITVTAITAITAVPTGITAPAIPGTPGHPVTLSWTGTADASNTPGDYTWEVTFEDAVNGTPVTVEVTITIGDLPPTHQIANASAGDGTSGTPYTTEYTVGMTSINDVDLASVTDPNVGQTPVINSVTPSASAFTFMLAGGFLNIAPAGTLLATDVGTHTFDVEITDGTNLINIHVSVTVSAAPEITQTNPLPNGEQGQTYAGLTIAATGGTGGLTFAVVSGTLPPGITLGANGLLSGLPSQQGAYAFTVTATDALGVADQEAFDLTIDAPATGTPTITTTTLANGVLNNAYGPETLQATGGAAPYSFTISSGNLPNGLTMSAAGVISGTPTTAQTANFDVTVTDAVFASSTASFSITIQSPPPGSGGGSGGGGGGCVADQGNTSYWALLLGAMALLGVALRKRAVQD